MKNAGRKHTKAVKPVTLRPAVRFYYNAFVDLETCRQLGFDEGRIPWDKIQKYAEVLNLPNQEAEVLHKVIRETDNAIITDRIKQQKAQQDKGNKANGNISKSGRTSRSKSQDD